VQQESIELRTEIKTLLAIIGDSDLLAQVFTNLMEYAVKIMPQDGEVLVLGRIECGNVLILVKDRRPRVALDGMGAASCYLPGGQVTASWRAVRDGIGVDDHPLDCSAPLREIFCLQQTGR